MLRDLDGRVLDAWRADEVLRTASVGKILALAALARSPLTDAALSPAADAGNEVDWPGPDEVGDSGLWQVLQARRLSPADAAVLVAAVSDNAATNALIDRIGLARIETLAREAGLRDVALLDRVRRTRGPAMPWTLSTGSARELSELAMRLDRGTFAGTEPDAQVVDWLTNNTDLLVAGGIGLDPLAHRVADLPAGCRLWNKTGSDNGVRADVGVLRAPDTGAGGAPAATGVAFAVVAAWQDGGYAITAAVEQAMRRVGEEWLSPLLAGF